MTATIKVWPTKATAVGMLHPHGPPLIAAGAEWPDDSFTARRLRDGSATVEAGEAYEPPKEFKDEPPRTEPLKADALGKAEGRNAIEAVKAG